MRGGLMAALLLAASALLLAPSPAEGKAGGRDGLPREGGGGSQTRVAASDGDGQGRKPAPDPPVGIVQEWVATGHKPTGGDFKVVWQEDKKLQAVDFDDLEGARDMSQWLKERGVWHQMLKEGRQIDSWKHPEGSWPAEWPREWERGTPLEAQAAWKDLEQKMSGMHERMRSEKERLREMKEALERRVEEGRGRRGGEGARSQEPVGAAEVQQDATQGKGGAVRMDGKSAQSDGERQEQHRLEQQKRERELQAREQQLQDQQRQEQQKQAQERQEQQRQEKLRQEKLRQVQEQQWQKQQKHEQERQRERRARQEAQRQERMRRKAALLEAKEQEAREQDAREQEEAARVLEEREAEAKLEEMRRIQHELTLAEDARALRVEREAQEEAARQGMRRMQGQEGGLVFMEDSGEETWEEVAAKEKRKQHLARELAIEAEAARVEKEIDRQRGVRRRVHNDMVRQKLKAKARAELEDRKRAMGQRAAMDREELRAASAAAGGSDSEDWDELAEEERAARADVESAMREQGRQRGGDQEDAAQQRLRLASERMREIEERRARAEGERLKRKAEREARSAQRKHANAGAVGGAVSSAPQGQQQAQRAEWERSAESVEVALAPLNNKCFYHYSGWWSYEVCHKRRIVQFHGDSNRRELRVNSKDQQFRLGNFKQGVSVGQSQEGGVQITHNYDGGTPCSEDGGRRPRTAEVLYKCLLGFAVNDGILMVEEPGACHYRITFVTEYLCTTADRIRAEERERLETAKRIQKSLESQGLSAGGTAAGNVAAAVAAITDAQPPWSESLIEGSVGVKGRLGHAFHHCFSLDQSCSFTFWMWIKKPEVGEQRPKEWPAELSVLHVKEQHYRVSPHLLWGLPQFLIYTRDIQMPGHLFCGLHQIANNQMVGAFTNKPLQQEQWHHISVVFHKGRHLECMVDGSIQTVVAAPNTIQPTPPDQRTPLFLGGSVHHFAPPTVFSKVVQMHHSALSEVDVRDLMTAERANLPILPPTIQFPVVTTDTTPATPEMRERHLEALVQSSPVAPRGIVLPVLNATGNEAQTHYIIQYLKGHDHALLALAHRHLHGIDETQQECYMTAAYYKMAAEVALSEVNALDTQQVEFVRLSVETEKSNAFNGHRGEEDEVVKYHQQLADSGDPRAQAWLGHRYYWGAGGVPRDRQRAFQYLERAAEAGNMEAQYNLGVMHAYGHGVPRNRERSMELFRQAADRGYVAAQNGLAVALTDGGKDSNFTEAFLYFERSALTNNADGLYNAALLLKDGKGVVKDEIRAFEYLRRSADQDHMPARIALGVMALNGRGGGMEKKPDCGFASHQFKIAAERGRWGQLLRDGLQAYLNGDVDSALRFYETAAELGYEVAQSNAAWLYENKCPSETCHVPEEVARRKAVHYLKLAAQNGNHEAMRGLGDALWEGRDRSPDFEGALAHYRKASEAGDTQSTWNLAYSYYTGIGASRDVETATKLMKKEYHRTKARGTAHMYPVMLLLGAIKAEAWVNEFVDGAKTLIEKIVHDVPEAVGRYGGKKARVMLERYILELMLAATLLFLAMLQVVWNMLAVPPPPPRPVQGFRA